MSIHRILIFKKNQTRIYLSFAGAMTLVLLCWFFSHHLLPYFFKRLSTINYALLTAFAVLCLGTVTAIHEVVYAQIARLLGRRVFSVTIVPLGAQHADDVESCDEKETLLLNICPPLATLMLAIVAYLVHAVLAPFPKLSGIDSLVQIFAGMAGLVTFFNALPLLPYDAGNFLRALIGKVTGHPRWATNVVSGLGFVFSALLVALGVACCFSANWGGGLWWLMLGGLFGYVSYRAQWSARRLPPPIPLDVPLPWRKTA